MTNTETYEIAHRPCPFCQQSLAVDPKMDNYVCLNKECPQYHTYVCVTVMLGRRYSDKWVPDPDLKLEDLGKQVSEPTSSPTPEPLDEETPEMALNVEHSTRTTTTHSYQVETNPPVGAAIGDILKAYSMAAAEAKDMGIDTSFDDWARVHALDDTIAIEFDAPSKD